MKAKNSIYPSQELNYKIINKSDGLTVTLSKTAPGKITCQGEGTFQVKVSVPRDKFGDDYHIATDLISDVITVKKASDEIESEE